MLKYKPVSENFDLSGKTAIVTGAASGIGKATVEFLSLKNVTVIGADINPETDRIMKMVNPSFEGVCVDVASNEDRKRLVEYVVNRFGRIDILVNCAGVVLLESAEKLSEADWDKTMSINLKAAFTLSQLVAGQMILQEEGSIVNVASQAGIIALDKHIAYCASKAGLISVTQVLAYEWARYGIRVNAVSPTVVMTDLGKKAWAGEVGEKMKKQIPAERFAEPDEIAAAIAFLCSSAAGMITGANIVIDGGYTIK